MITEKVGTFPGASGTVGGGATSLIASTRHIFERTCSQRHRWDLGSPGPTDARMALES
jgi:hypothetical protein